jgi:SAM-dependent methyltransferase
VVTEGSDYVAANRAYWDDASVRFEAPGVDNWRGEPVWGVFGVGEEHLGVLPSDLAGKVVLEDGCGTAYVSAWLARRGARPIGLDNSPRQLASAGAFQKQFKLAFPLVLGIAEALPFADEVFDVVISEYGAAIWSDPYVWIPEAARVLKAGGQLIFLGTSVIQALSAPDLDDGTPTDEVLKRPQANMHRFEWADSDGIEFHLSHGDQIRLLHESGFAIDDLIEVYARPGAASAYTWASAEWAAKWPVEEIWKATKVSG